MSRRVVALAALLVAACAPARYLLANGVPVILDGAFTGAKPRRWIRGPVHEPREGSGE